MKEPFDISSKVVVCTGVGSGIGKSIAHTFLANGAYGFIGVDIDETLEEMYKKELSNYSKSFYVICGDVSNENDVKKYLDLALTKFGRVDVMINNAAYAQAIKIHKTPEDIWDKTFNVNVKSLYINAIDSLSKHNLIDEDSEEKPLKDIFSGNVGLNVVQRAKSKSFGLFSQGG